MNETAAQQSMNSLWVIKVMGLMLLATFVLGQTRPLENTVQASTKNVLPDSSDIELEMRRIEPERKQMFAPHCSGNTTHLFPNISTPARAEIDIETIVKQYKQKIATRQHDALMIFVSFTLPVQSLKRIISQANQVGASVVLNGFKRHSLKETLLAIQSLDEQGGDVLINPNAFNQYRIQVVPTIVIAKFETIGQLGRTDRRSPDSYVAVSGDVSLEYALDQIMRRAPQFKSIASRYLDQIQKNRKTVPRLYR